ncbi:ATCAY isoform 4 [Pan troglodytes]|uniref:ATCAY kinesin light chain interacting caytaxin n=2 Tax=Homininae TaxID=207598 RepID=M0R225_HUMAN|nr:ATCAY kinesin light chain interacting caytaxin [Homo sapiens]KAI4039627.1 ATCAY kinesin light chain interacting caytaxin [Homo sapiens]PNI25142.1 ATCAY isoform 4 [Pan troglodytes]
MGTTEATLRMENVDVKEEWQDEDLPSQELLCTILGTTKSKIHRAGWKLSGHSQKRRGWNCLAARWKTHPLLPTR